MESLHQQGVQFRSLTDAIDTSTASGRFFFYVMASLAEMEREIPVERTRAGLEAARLLGRKGGHKRKGRWRLQRSCWQAVYRLET